MKGQGAGLDRQALAKCYEALRQDVVEAGGPDHPLRTRALLMFRGMAAWMRCVGECAMDSPTPVAPRNGLRLPVGIEQNLIDIVATMALATAREAVA